jgi:glycosyltransferase involved in cell wall biosynthesis
MQQKNSRPKVAIITRTKNRNLLLERVLQCVDAQTYDDYVHVVINDGGDEKALRELLDKHPNPRRQVIYNDKSLGCTKALNKAIRSAVSEFIAIIDDDDTWNEDYLLKSMEVLDSTGSKGVVSAMDLVIEQVKDGEIEKLRQERWRPDIKEVSIYGHCIDNRAPTVTFVYSRDVYDELNGYDETLEVSEDWDFTLRFLLKYDIEFIDSEEALSCYHHRPEAEGDDSNSIFAGTEKHHRNMGLLANKYFRQEINQGVFGPGYVISKLRYEREIALPREQNLRDQQTVRLEGHINYASAEQNREIGDMVHGSTAEVQRSIAGSLFTNRVRNKLRAIKNRFKA